MQTSTGIRDAALLVAALPALIAVFGARDVTKIVAFLGSSDFAPVLGILIAGDTVAWRWWNARRQSAEKAVLAGSADDVFGKVVP